MAFKKYLLAFGLLWMGVLVLPAVAAEPGINDVYKAAKAGKLDKAQEMMKSVLSAHPNSAKAHFVEAELLAKQQDFDAARQELGTAENLAPGLSFAKPRAVSELRSLLAAHPAAVELSPPPFTPPVVQNEPPPSNMMASILSYMFVLVVAVGAVVLLIMFIRALVLQPRARPAMPGPVGGWNPGYPQSGYPQAPGGGMASGVLGGLATGVAVGAGVALGEALVDRALDSHHTGSQTGGWDSGSSSSSNDTSSYDMGGTDFGVSDSSSWDSGSSDSFSSDSGSSWD
ncbi:tetratricopeptide repeat protein [Uliginosibacterium gangwonense]|uniref:tetratricopeptide repeat protein n=1 Tax=Uliginosibacterium gangwonense TaxID=392736 RepID=UPI00037A13C3|nr:tetratricopeptide repeat protein [Uliginosibacterium gangwonense]